MIPRTSTTWQSTWQTELARAISDPTELLSLLDLPLDGLTAARISAQDFSLRVPRGYVARMEKGNPHDPLLRQVLPLVDEQYALPGFSLDAVGDLNAMPVPGLLHKYQGRVLLVTTGACAIHCRYCFRRHFPYAEANPATEQWESALAYIRADASISEVILSGGDPLVMTDQRLSTLAQQLETIPHLTTLRIHSRLPVVLPERINSTFLDWFTGTRLKPVMVIHANHANEIDAGVRQALKQLAACGAMLLNQSVLLQGVNDHPQTLAALSKDLFDAGVLPYYLHLLDKVQGAAHFDVDAARACRIMNELRARLPGYLVPRLVQECAGGSAKQPVSAA